MEKRSPCEDIEETSDALSALAFLVLSTQCIWLWFWGQRSEKGRGRREGRSWMCVVTWAGTQSQRMSYMSAVPCWRLTVFPRSFSSLPEHKGVYQPVMIKQQNLVLRKEKEWHRTKKCTYLCRVKSKQKRRQEKMKQEETQRKRSGPASEPRKRWCIWGCGEHQQQAWREWPLQSDGHRCQTARNRGWRAVVQTCSGFGEEVESWQKLCPWMGWAGMRGRLQDSWKQNTLPGRGGEPAHGQRRSGWGRG